MDRLVSRRESSSELVRAPRPLVAVVAEAIERIDKILAELALCGVRVAEDSRLHQAKGLLLESITGRGITPRQRGDDLGLRALETALDFHTIAASIDPQMPASVRRELRDSLRGKLSPPESKLGPLQLQSQAVAFGAFQLAGCYPRHPPKSRESTPDILLNRGMSTYAVETKRPQVRANVIPRFIEGYDQIVASGYTGAVLIDVTDCVRGLQPDAVHLAVEEIGLVMLETAATENGRRPEFRSLICAGCYARVQAIASENEGEAVVDIVTSARVAVLANVRNTLEDHRARWIRDSHERGMKAIYDPITSGSSQTPSDTMAGG